MGTTTSPTPTKLGADARRLWDAVTTTYELRPDELRVLKDACREIDLIEKIQRYLDSRGSKLIVHGSMGQPVSNPMVQEIRQHRLAVRTLLKSIDLPDDVADVPVSKSERARAAANARWRRPA